MKITLAASALFALCAPSCREQQAHPIAVQPHDALDSVQNIRATLERIFPDKPIPIYKVRGGALLAVVQDFDADRFLLVRAQGWLGTVTITRDGTELEPPFEEQTIKLYGSLIGDTGSHEDRLRIGSDHLGFWIPLKRGESLSLVANLEAPEAARVNLAYSPREGWSGSIEPSRKNDQ